jgi:acetyl-CoA C-acetyltransferase
MSPDPRAPVLVGAGQIIQRFADGSPGEREALEPLALMDAAARRAASDTGRPAILGQLDSIRVPRGLWPYQNPAFVLRERFGASRASTALAPVSGNMVQYMLTDAAREIAAGNLDSVLIAGAEAEHTKRRAKRAGRDLGWLEDESPAPDLDFTEGGRWILQEEIDAGLTQPAAIFSLYENARRHAAGEGLEENRDRIARLWRRFAEVAEANPFAWTREPPAIEVIRDDGPDNKMQAWPYTKRLCSNMVVDQGAAVILCSVERALELGIPRDRWVYLHTATDCMATPLMSHRMDFVRMPSLELAGRRALALSAAKPEDFAFVELYSCFPAAVQVACEALGFSSERPLTVTGGLPYAGGPFNSYVLHALATTLVRLREDRGSKAFVSSVGGSFNKHAFGIYSTEQPEDGFRYANLDAEAEKLPQRELCSSYEGDARIETYALRYKDGEPSSATFACLLDDGRRVWATSADARIFEDMLRRETCGRLARIAGRSVRALL